MQNEDERKIQDVTLKSIWAPREEREHIEKKGFYDNLDKICSFTSKYDMMLVVGNRNTKVRKNKDQRQATRQCIIRNNKSLIQTWSLSLLRKTTYLSKSHVFLYSHLLGYMSSTWNWLDQPHWPYIGCLLYTSRCV